MVRKEGRELFTGSGPGLLPVMTLMLTARSPRFYNFDTYHKHKRVYTKHMENLKNNKTKTHVATIQLKK